MCVGVESLNFPFLVIESSKIWLKPNPLLCKNVLQDAFALLSCSASDESSFPTLLSQSRRYKICPHNSSTKPALQLKPALKNSHCSFNKSLKPKEFYVLARQLKAFTLQAVRDKSLFLSTLLQCLTAPLA